MIINLCLFYLSIGTLTLLYAVGTIVVIVSSVAEGVQ